MVSAIAKRLWQPRKLSFQCWLLFFASGLIYLLNNQVISSNDNLPATLIALHWLEHHTLHLDLFGTAPAYTMPDGTTAYFFTKAPNGHLTSSYPIGSVIVSYPLYFLCFVYLKVSAFINAGFRFSDLSIDLTSADFNQQRMELEKLAGAILTALANVCFYLVCRLKFSPAAALLTTFIFAFATSNWVVSSQGLWQHTVTNLLLTAALLCLFKANRAESLQSVKLLLAIAGFLTGLLPGTRVTNYVFVVPIALYVALVYRRQAVYFLLGAASFLLNAAWNVYYFGFGVRSLLIGGYADLLRKGVGSYRFEWEYFRAAFWGLLFSPSRGLLVYSPVVLLAAPGLLRVFQQRRGGEEKLVLGLTLSSAILFVNIAFFVPWWGGINFSSRYLVDSLPIVCLLIGYFLHGLFEGVRPVKPQAFALIFAVVLALTAYSTAVQAIGSFSRPHLWDTVPYFDPERYWDWNDNQLERHTRNLLMRIHPPFGNRKEYFRQLDGVVERLKLDSGQEITGVLSVSPARYVKVWAEVKNTGAVPWYGYNTGAVRGRVVLKTKFIDGQGKEASPTLDSYLYLQDVVQPGQVGLAVGYLGFPHPRGRYQVKFDLQAQEMGSYGQQVDGASYSIEAFAR